MIGAIFLTSLSFVWGVRLPWTVVCNAPGVVWQGARVSPGDHQAHPQQDPCHGPKPAENCLGAAAVLSEQQPALGRCSCAERCQAQGELQSLTGLIMCVSACLRPLMGHSFVIMKPKAKATYQAEATCMYILLAD